jgi:hypothetical protein
VTVIDSAYAGVRRFPNYSNVFENNIIQRIGRAGIVTGNDENTIIRGNRIHGITGDVVNEKNEPVDIDCAGIILGG